MGARRQFCKDQALPPQEEPAPANSKLRSAAIRGLRPGESRPAPSADAPLHLSETRQILAIELWPSNSRRLPARVGVKMLVNPFLVDPSLSRGRPDQTFRTPIQMKNRIHTWSYKKSMAAMKNMVTINTALARKQR